MYKLHTKVVQSVCTTRVQPTCLMSINRGQNESSPQSAKTYYTTPHILHTALPPQKARYSTPRKLLLDSLLSTLYPGPIKTTKNINIY